MGMDPSLDGSCAETTVVQALDPQVIVSVTENDALSPVTYEVGRRLSAALASVTRAFADERAASSANPYFERSHDG